MPSNMTSSSEEIMVTKELEARWASVAVYQDAGSSSKKVGYFTKDEGTKIATLYRNNYYHLGELDGWVYENNVVVVEDLSEQATEELDPETQEEIKKVSELTQEQISQFTEEEKKSIYMQFVNQEYGGVMSDDGAADSLLVNNLNGVWGIPYQFPETVDFPLDGNGNSKISFGSIYADRIVMRMPLLILSPGKVSFMQGFKDGERLAVLDSLASDSGNASAIGDFLEKPGKYYTFEYAQAEYWSYVNAMNKACAVYLGIDDVNVNINGVSGTLGAFDWEKSSNNKFDSLMVSNQSYLCFYADAETTKTESFSNSTQKSQLADKLNGFSDIGKEINFLVGAHTGNDLKAWFEQTDIDSALQGINSVVDEYLNGSTLVKQMANEFSIIATGGKLMFPEIWGDSEFTQSLDVKMKLRCPCPNKVSWFLDILVPLNMLIALTMPRTPTDKDSMFGIDFSETPSANGYFSPFLVRGFYKGLFSCDMGIITDLSISKGKEGSWTIDGLPSEVDVDITIKDLYNTMAMTSDEDTTNFLNNTTFLNYLANACGISINKPDVERSIDLWLMMKTDYWKEKLTGYTFWQHATQGAKNKLYDLYTGIFGVR